MRVRIIKAIPTPRLEGFDVSDYREGMVYETGRSIGEVLFAYGYAVPEEGRATTRRPRPTLAQGTIATPSPDAARRTAA